MSPKARGWLVATLLIGGVYLGFYLNRMWYPHDEGALGQTAERVLGGEVPHRDFDEPYTGLLTYVHAAAFATFGVRLTSLRIPLFIATMLWLVAVFRIALRSTGPPGAAAVSLVALAWSVPNYPASMPSWYNLFFATFGAAALLRWDESRLARWLVLAGMAGGISFLFKLSGLFFIAGGGLFLFYAADRDLPIIGRRNNWLAVLLTLASLAVAVGLWRTIHPGWHIRLIYQFVAPGALMALALAVREWWPPYHPPGPRLRALFAAAVPYLGGVLVPVLIFGLVFVAAGALPALYHGVFVAPFKRLVFASRPPPPAMWILAVVPLAMLLRPRADPRAHTRQAAVVLSLLFAALLALAYFKGFPHRYVWETLRELVPWLCLVATVVIAWPRLAKDWVAGSASRFVLLAMVTGFAALIQYPFAASIYFLYVSPLVILSTVTLIRGINRSPLPMAASTLAFYGAFAVLLVTPGAVEAMGYRTIWHHPTVRLDLPRAGLRVKPVEAELYGALIPEVQSRAAGGDIWAGPDAPEVYFLSGSRNRSRAVFDFLGDAGERMAVLRTLDGVRVIVLNLTPLFSPPLEPALVDSLRARFPEGHEVGHFEVRWRP